MQRESSRKRRMDVAGWGGGGFVTEVRKKVLEGLPHIRQTRETRMEHENRTDNSAH